MRCSHHPLRHYAGFTLIELLVGLFIMALLAGLSWRGLDGMSRAQATSRARADQVATLSTALAQWQTDLDQIIELPNQSALDFDGRVLRMTRSYGKTELRVVGWAKRTVGDQQQWLRWQSGVVDTKVTLQAAWDQAQRWGQNPGDAERRNETVIANIDDWQIFYFRNNSWTNPQSSSNSSNPLTPGTAEASVLPEGVRLVLTLSAGQSAQPVSGVLTKDWVRPILGGGS